MGVRGLTTYITYNEDLFLRDFRLHDTCLVVDGFSLCAQLYQRLVCNSAFGGDYDKYAALVRKFFLDLRKCKIECYVLFDGSFERKKLKTVFSRLRSKINGVSRLYPGNQSTISIFPLFMRDVFKEVLVELKVLHTVCEFEADDEIAALARHLNCPVLSYDSDFFIYNVQYIPFKSCNIKPVCHQENDSKFNAIECKIYKTEYFVEHFQGFNADLLPLLATLLGNDYIKKKIFENFFAHLKLPKSAKKKNEQQRSIQAVIDWLKNETVDSAIMKIIGRLKKNQKERVLKIITESCNSYTKTDCASLQYLNLLNKEENEKSMLTKIDIAGDDKCDSGDASESEDQSESDKNSETDNSSVGSSVIEDVKTFVQNNADMDSWLIKGIRNGSIPQPYINMYVHGIYFCIPQAEDCDDEDSFMICLPMIRYAYDILTHFSKKNLTYISRDGTQYKKVYLNEEDAFECPFSNYEFESPLQNEGQMPEYFTHFFNSQLVGLDWQTLEILPSNVRILILSIIWYVKYGKVTLAHVYSILLCHVMLGAVDKKTGTPRTEFYFNNRNAKKLEELKKLKCNKPSIFDESNLLVNKNKIEYDDCLLAASVMIGLFEMNNGVKKHPRSYDTRKIHSLAQFQCCLQQINYLNRLCNCKYEPTVIHETYSGIFIYNLLDKLSEQSDPMLFIEKYLNGAETVILYVKSIFHILEKCFTGMNLTLHQLTHLKRRRRGKRGKDVGFIVEGFESEVII